MKNNNCLHIKQFGRIQKIFQGKLILMVKCWIQNVMKIISFYQYQRERERVCNEVNLHRGPYIQIPSDQHNGTLHHIHTPHHQSSPPRANVLSLFEACPWPQGVLLEVRSSLHHLSKINIEVIKTYLDMCITQSFRTNLCGLLFNNIELQSKCIQFFFVD